MTRGEARLMRRMIETAARGLSDAQALAAPGLYPQWQAGKYYALDDRVRCGGALYRCLQGHTAQETWAPDTAPSLFARVLIEDPAKTPEWEQPDSTNAYSRGDRVTHGGKIWQSDLDANVWEPGVYGWTEVTE